MLSTACIETLLGLALYSICVSPATAEKQFHAKIKILLKQNMTDLLCSTYSRFRSHTTYFLSAVPPQCADKAQTALGEQNMTSHSNSWREYGRRMCLSVQHEGFKCIIKNLKCFTALPFPHNDTACISNALLLNCIQALNAHLGRLYLQPVQHGEHRLVEHNERHSSISEADCRCTALLKGRTWSKILFGQCFSAVC